MASQDKFDVEGFFRLNLGVVRSLSWFPAGLDGQQELGRVDEEAKFDVWPITTARIRSCDDTSVACNRLDLAMGDETSSWACTAVHDGMVHPVCLLAPDLQGSTFFLDRGLPEDQGGHLYRFGSYMHSRVQPMQLSWSIIDR